MIRNERIITMSKVYYELIGTEILREETLEHNSRKGIITDIIKNSAVILWDDDEEHTFNLTTEKLDIDCFCPVSIIDVDDILESDDYKYIRSLI